MCVCVGGGGGGGWGAEDMEFPGVSRNSMWDFQGSLFSVLELRDLTQFCGILGLSFVLSGFSRAK